MQFLYMGFAQQANVRCFRFQGILPRERTAKSAPAIDLKLNADLSLLARYKISIQDGPTLCLQILVAALTGAEDNVAAFASYSITLDDVIAFAAARTAIEDAKIAHRKPRRHFKPLASSQLKWPQTQTK
jgi:hypothetical protein